MKTHLVRFAALLLMFGGFCAYAGELSYIPIPASQSDANSGFSNTNQYTTALDAGSEANRSVNGVTLYASPGSGQNIIANNCSVTASSGSLITTGGATENIQADGMLREVLSDVIYNSDAADNSQQEIVLNPASLTPGATYDLRVYIGKGGNGDRQVNLAFVGDGQAPTETGFFNEDDARTSAGQFQDPNQVYVINYRFTWDGNSAPGITVTQKSGQAPFVLYALTNHPVAAPANAAAAPPPQPPAGGQAINAGLVTAEADQVGVTSDTFYSNEALNTKGRWIGVKKYGRCWQPNDYPSDWRPYTRGNWKHCEDCGWTWVSDASEEEWGWATYHYGRWVRVGGVGCGWAWVPGTVWGPGWVSWRKGETPDCTCVGWAPLPPEAPCEVGVGVSRWVDRTCDIGPDNYTFVHVRDFGSNNYRDCGCVLERKRYVNIVEHTVNITNISYVNVNVNINVGGGLHVNVYNGGPDFNWCNTEIRRHGGQEMVQIHINRYDDPVMFKNKKFSHHDGNMLNLFTPKVFAQKQTKFTPKLVVNVADSKIDHGWNEIKDKKIKSDLKTKIADQTKGLTPETTKAELPKNVATKLATGVGQGTAATEGGDVDWKRTVRGDGTDVMPTDPKALASLKAYAAQNATSPETFFAMYTKQTAADRAAEKAAKNPKDDQARADAAAADAEYKKAFDAFDAEAVANKSKAVSSPLPTARTPIPGVEGVTGPEGPKGATATPGQSPSATLSADQIKALDPLNLNKGKSPSPSASPSATLSADQIKALDPLGLNKGATATPGTTGTASPAATASPARTFPETYKPPLTLRSPTPDEEKAMLTQEHEAAREKLAAAKSEYAVAMGALNKANDAAAKAPRDAKLKAEAAAQNERASKLEVAYKAASAAKHNLDAKVNALETKAKAAATSTPAASASPTRTFPETYKPPLTLKSPAPGATGTATPPTGAKEAGAPTELKPLPPGALKSAPLQLEKGHTVFPEAVAPAGAKAPAAPGATASPTRTFPETYKPPLTLQSATPTPSVGKQSGPAFLKDTETPPPTASPTRTFPETYKPPITLKSPTPGATGTATPATGASPTRTFPETYKPPITLKSAIPAPTATKVPAAPKGLSLEGQTTPTPASTPIKTPAPKTQPAPSPQFNPAASPSPKPIASPQFNPADASPQPRTTPVKTAQPKIQPAASPQYKPAASPEYKPKTSIATPPPSTATPRPSITPDAAAAAAKANAAAAAKANAAAAAKANAAAAAKANAAAAAKANADAAAKANAAAAAKANADAAAKANAAAKAQQQQQKVVKPTPTPTPTPIH